MIKFLPYIYLCNIFHHYIGTELGAKNAVLREYDETKTQLETDTDKEIEQLKEKYDKKLHTERDATLRLKGENGIMKKKFSALQKVR